MRLAIEKAVKAREQLIRRRVTRLLKAADLDDVAEFVSKQLTSWARRTRRGA